MTRLCQCLKFHSAFHVAITSRSFSLNFCKVKMAKKQAAAAVENCTRLHKNDWIRDRLLAFFAIHVFLHKRVETKKSVSGRIKVNLRMSVKVLGQFWWSFLQTRYLYGSNIVHFNFLDAFKEFYIHQHWLGVSKDF